jgi:hypothetical protein
MRKREDVNLRNARSAARERPLRRKNRSTGET